METRKIYGLLAEFDKPDALLVAIRKARTYGYRRMEAFTPFPMEDVEEALKLPPSPIPWIVLAGAIAGALTGFFMQLISNAVALTINVGGRPLDSWPAYIPITFELMVLFETFAGLAGLFFLDGLPQPYHPVFNVPSFAEHGSSDRFYLAIEGRDLMFDRVTTREYLTSLGATQVSEVRM